MVIYTGRVDKGLNHKNFGTRYLTISRLSDNSGLMSIEYLWKNDKYDLFDIWNTRLAPNGVDVNKFYKGETNWEEFSRRYIEKIHSPDNFDFLMELSLTALEKNIVLQCVCGDYKKCHRNLLAENIRIHADSQVEIVHLD